MKIKIGGQSETIWTWIWNFAMWISVIVVIIGLLTACESKSGKRARQAREQLVLPLIKDTVLIYTSPAKDRLYHIEFKREENSMRKDIYFVQNIHGEITSINVTFK